jgi:O-antigen ligase
VIYYGWVVRRRAVVTALMAALLGAAAVVSQLGSNVMPSFGKGIQEFTAYWAHESSGASEPNPQATTSIGTRMEMLRSVAYIARDYPVFGVGGYNFGKVVNGYIDAGKIDESLRDANHPHNVLAEVQVSKGLIGLGIFLLMVGIPFWCFVRGGVGVGLRPTTAFFGLGFLAALMTMMMTESAIVLKGNFIATFILFISAFFAQHRQAENE